MSAEVNEEVNAERDTFWFWKDGLQKAAMATIHSSVHFSLHLHFDQVDGAGLEHEYLGLRCGSTP